MTDYSANNMRFSADENRIQYAHSYTEHVRQNDFSLHTHDNYEVYLLLRGKIRFVVEGSVYPLQPNDVIIVRDGEMHNIYTTSDEPYERIVINLPRDFFTRYHCETMCRMFTQRIPGSNNLLPASCNIASGVTELFFRMKQYQTEEEPLRNTVLCSTLTELLYLLYRTHQTYAHAPVQTGIISPLLNYINKNLANDLSLDLLAAQFYVSKYHLCRIFKKHTGYTIANYVTAKRLLAVKEYCRKGEKITSACALAGFSGYTSFYKAYKQRYGIPPKDGLGSIDKGNEK